MFDKFGPLTYEELNKTAEGLKMEGDIESLILLAEENGLEKEDAEDYADGVVDTFTILGTEKMSFGDAKP